MVLDDFLLSPIGLGALLTAVPVVYLYLIQPDPQEIELPTVRFIFEEEEQDSSRPLFDRLRRNTLLLLQLLIIVILAIALAGPYISVAQSQTVSETVLVIDGSASMLTETSDSTRFEQAVSEAKQSSTGTNSIVYAGNRPKVVLQTGTPSETATALDGLQARPVPANLQAAITQATAVAGENARIVVLSDFAGNRWVEAVRSARAQGLQVSLEQFNDGGEANIGFISQSFSGQNITYTIKNFGSSTVTSTVSVGNSTKRVRLSPDGITDMTFRAPPGGGRAELRPTDSFAEDNIAYVSAPTQDTVDVLLLSNDPNRYLQTALSVIDVVSLSVREPPTSIRPDYDVILYSDVAPERLLDGSVETGRDIVSNGGGAGIVAQESPPTSYQDLLLINPEGTAANPTVVRGRSSPLTEQIEFPPPEQYLRGSLTNGQTHIATSSGSPLIATAERGQGRILYYGSLADSDPFRFNYQYPVFWKRAVFYLAGRAQTSSLNRETGERLQYENTTTVEGPTTTLTGQTISLQETGIYRGGGKTYAVSLMSESESAVDTASVSETQASESLETRQEETVVSRPLTWVVALLGGAIGLLEVGLLRRRGDL